MSAVSELCKAATHAAEMLGAVYEWVDRVEASGGPTTLSGIATCHAMIVSLKHNRPLANKLVVEPLRKALSEVAP